VQPRALSSMNMMPPPIIADRKIESMIVPDSKYWM
jgi:hypothetical protein